MKITCSNFKNYLLVCCFFCLFLSSKAQSIRDKVVVFGKVDMPGFMIRPVEGGSAYNLQDYLKKGADKPILMVFWAKSWCGPCLRLIDTLLMGNLDKKYYIMTINIEGGIKDGANLGDMDKVISERVGWNRINHFQASFKMYKDSLGIETTPFMLFFNKKGQIVDSFSGYGIGLKDVMGSLDIIKSGKYDSDGKYFYNNVLANEKDATTYSTKTISGNKVVINSYKKDNKLINFTTYLIKDKKIIVDGVYKSFYDNGKIYYDAFYKNGLLMTAKKWFDDGTIIEDVNLPEAGEGYYKVWYNEGTKKFNYKYVNRILEGVSYYYNKTEMHELTYKKDILIAKRIFKNGNLDKEYKYVDGKEVEVKVN